MLTSSISLLAKDIAISNSRLQANSDFEDIPVSIMELIELSTISIASTAIDSSSRSIEEADTALIEILESILSSWNEFEQCRWIAEETIHIMRVFMASTFDYDSSFTDIDSDDISVQMRKIIQEYHPELADLVSTVDDELRTTYDLVIEPFYSRIGVVLLELYSIARRRGSAP
eukprot:IDg3862t1